MRVWLNKTALRIAQGGPYIQFWSGYHRLSDQIFEQDLKRHGMSATLVGKEELAITTKHPVIVRNMMVIIVPVKSKVELVKAEAMPVFSVALGFFQLADQSIIHGKGLLFSYIK